MGILLQWCHTLIGLSASHKYAICEQKNTVRNFLLWEWETRTTSHVLTYEFLHLRRGNHHAPRVLSISPECLVCRCSSLWSRLPRFVLWWHIAHNPSTIYINLFFVLLPPFTFALHLNNSFFPNIFWSLTLSLSHYIKWKEHPRYGLIGNHQSKVSLGLWVLIKSNMQGLVNLYICLIKFCINFVLQLCVWNVYEFVIYYWDVNLVRQFVHRRQPCMC